MLTTLSITAAILAAFALIGTAVHAIGNLWRSASDRSDRQ